MSLKLPPKQLVSARQTASERRIREQAHSHMNCVRRATANDPSFPSITNIPANAFRSKLMGVPSPSHPNTNRGQEKW